jgi:LPXTG-motif cell wall-anchored protein
MTAEARLAAYTIFGTMVVFKVATAIFIFSLYPTSHAAAFLGLTNLIWFALIGLPLLLGGAFWYRRVRVRARRKQLIYAEWHVEPAASARPAGRPGS